MPKFLNKNELVLLSLTILLFDVSGFCVVSYPYIVNGQGNLITIIIMMFLLAYSVFVFHTICNSYPSYSVQYTPPHNVYESVTCENTLERIKRDKDLEIIEMKKICGEPSINHATYLSEKLVLSVVAIIFLLFIYVGIFKVHNIDDNITSSRVLRSIPMMLMALGLLSFANIYIPFFSNIK